MSARFRLASRLISQSVIVAGLVLIGVALGPRSRHGGAPAVGNRDYRNVELLISNLKNNSLNDELNSRIATLEALLGGLTGAKKAIHDVTSSLAPSAQSLPPASILPLPPLPPLTVLLPPRPLLWEFVIFNTDVAPLAPWVLAGVEWLRKRQFDGVECATARVLLIGTDMVPSEGMGALSHVVARRLALAVSQHRVLVGTNHGWPYGGPNEEIVGRWAAGFLPLSPCTPSNVGSPSENVGLPFTTDFPGPRVMQGRNLLAKDYLALVPPEFSALGWRGWWTILIAFVLRPAEAMKEQVASYFSATLQR